MTCIIDAHENSDVMMTDIPTAFVQANIDPLRRGDARMIVKIARVVADLLARTALGFMAVESCSRMASQPFAQNL